MPKISGLGLGGVRKISGLAAGDIRKVSGLGLGLVWPPWPLKRPAVVFDASPNAATSHTLNYDSSYQVGDLLIAHVHHSRTSVGAYTIPAPSGWNLLLAQNDTASNGVYIAIFWRFKGAESSITSAASITTNGRSYATTLNAYDGQTVNATTPIPAALNAYALSAGTNAGAPSVTSTVADSELLLLGSSARGSATAITNSWGGGAVEVSDNTETVGSLTYSQSTATKALPAAGATGSHTVTFASGTVIQRFAASLIIAPA